MLNNHPETLYLELCINTDDVPCQTNKRPIMTNTNVYLHLGATYAV